LQRDAERPRPVLFCTTRHWRPDSASAVRAFSGTCVALLDGMSLQCSEPVQRIELRLAGALTLSLLLIYAIIRTFEYVKAEGAGDPSPCVGRSCTAASKVQLRIHRSGGLEAYESDSAGNESIGATRPRGSVRWVQDALDSGATGRQA
jgi:hypothetical protein